MRFPLLLTAVVTLLFCLLPSGDSTAQEGAREALTLEDAIERALESNMDLRRMKEELDAASYQRQQALYALPQGATSMQLLEADLQEDLASIRLDQQRKEIESRVYQAYYGTKVAEAALELQRSALRDAEETLRVARQAYEAGVGTRVDVLGAEAQHSRAKAAVDGAIKDLDVAWLNLNQLMNEPFDRRFNLTTLLRKNPPYDDDLEEIIEKAISVDANIREASRMITYFEDLSSIGMGSGRLMSAYMGKRAAEQHVERHVRQLHLEMWSAYRQIEPFEKAVELAQEQVRLAAMRFEAGIGTHGELLSAQRQLHEAQVGHLQALLQLNVARSQYRLLTESGAARR